MGRGRRQKRRKVVVESSSSSSEDEVDNEADFGVRKGAKIVGNVVDFSNRSPSPAEEDFQEEVHFPFCCCVCTCSDERKARVEGENEPLQPFRGFLWHRRCCHGFFKQDDRSYAPPFLVAQEEALKILERNEDTVQSELDWLTKSLIKRKYSDAKKQESQFYNDDREVHGGGLLLTSPEYQEGIVEPFKKLQDQIKANPEYQEGIVEPFEKLQDQIKANQRKRGGMVVVDLFAGIGTAIVVLKRLKIKIQKVIHVEHDKIATHVYKTNHDRQYNSNLPDDGGVEHVYIPKFEDFKRDYERILREHGPIDLAIGGPPCQDFCASNTHRQGVAGDQGKFMVQFGELVRTIERLQQIEFNSHPLFFLAENVILSGDDLFTVREAFGISWDPITFDAKYVSPTQRNRHFLTNIHVKSLMEFDYECNASHSHPSSCLEEDVVTVENLKFIKDENVLHKAPCFMATKTRIDDQSTLRMFVFLPEESVVMDNGKKLKRYFIRPIKIIERERMMGYSKGYVETPVTELFKELLDHGLSQIREGELWQSKLRDDLHTFAGNYHAFPNSDPYKFVLTDEKEIAVKMAPPLASKTDGASPSFFNAEEYAKHLIGNAYSVPVVELLLKDLTGLFAHYDYGDRFNYKYKWDEVDAEEMNSQHPEAPEEPQDRTPSEVDSEETACQNPADLPNPITPKIEAREEVRSKDETDVVKSAEIESHRPHCNGLLPVKQEPKEELESQDDSNGLLPVKQEPKEELESQDDLDKTSEEAKSKDAARECPDVPSDNKQGTQSIMQWGIPRRHPSVTTQDDCKPDAYRVDPGQRSRYSQVGQPVKFS